MKPIILFILLALCMAACGLMEQQDAESKARIKRDNIQCPKCHFCSPEKIKRVCSDYKMGV